MRRRLLMPVFFLAAVIAALAAVITIAGSYRQNGLLFGGKTSDFTKGWALGDGSAVALPGVAQASSGGAVTLVNTLPSKLLSGSVLYLNTTYQSLTVSVAGQQVFSWDIRDKAYFIHPFGLPSYIVSLPDFSAGQRIELRLTPSSPGEEVTVYAVTLGNGISTAIALEGQYIGTVILFFILAVLFGIICVSVVIFRKRFTGQSSADALWLSAFIALSAAWIISNSSLLLLFTTNIVATLYCSIFSLMLLPAPLLMFMRRFTPHGKPVLNSLALITLLNFTVCLFLMLLGKADLIQTLISSHILELLASIAVVTLCFIEFFKYKRRDLFDVFVGLALLCAFSVVSVILFSVGRNPESSVFAQAGLTAFVLALGISVARRGIHELARSQSYEKLTMSIPSGICRIESFESGRIVFANSFYFRLFGYSEEDAQRVGFSTAYFTVLPEDLDAVKEKIKNYVSGSHHSFETEARYVRKNGEVIWILARYRIERGSFGAITLVMIDITDRKAMEERLRISEEEYRIATLHSNKHIIRLDIRTRTSYGQTGLPSGFDAPAVLENVPESILSSGLIAQDSVEAFRGFYEAIFRGEREGSVVVSINDPNADEFRWYHYDFTSIFDDSSKPVQAIISFYDVTLQRQKELAFQRWQQSYNAIPKNTTNYYEYNLTSDLFEHQEGFMLPLVPETISRKLADVSFYIAELYVYPEDRDKWRAFMSRDRLLENYASGQHTDKHEFRRFIDGVPKWTSVGVQLIPDPYSSDVKGYFLLEDIDIHKKAEISLQERSTLDALTGLLNRVTFIDKFNDILLKSSPETQHALIMLDIDNFKTINDTFGHGAGDAVLINIASKLKYALRSDDLCGRLGGDEFVICLKNMNLGKPLETRVNDLCSMICDERSWGVSVSASFGISGFPYDGLTFEELYQKADIALYRAKSQGRGCFAVYDPQLSFDDMAIAVK